MDYKPLDEVDDERDLVYHLEELICMMGECILVIDPNKPRKLILARTGADGTMDCGRVPSNDWGGQTLDPDYIVKEFDIPTQIGTFADRVK